MTNLINRQQAARFRLRISRSKLADPRYPNANEIDTALDEAYKCGKEAGDYQEGWEEGFKTGREAAHDELREIFPDEPPEGEYDGCSIRACCGAGAHPLHGEHQPNCWFAKIAAAIRQPEDQP